MEVMTLETILLKDSSFHRWLLPYIDDIIGALSPADMPAHGAAMAMI